MKKRILSLLLCVVALLLALSSRTSDTGARPSESQPMSAPTSEASETKAPKSKSQQKVEEYLTGLGYDVAKSTESTSKMEFMITLPGFSDQDLSVCPESWAEISESVMVASSGISEGVPGLDGKNIVVYLQDSAGNNYLTIANGKQTYSAFADMSSGGYNPPTITLAEYDEIKTGMTFQEVYNIIGGAGEVISEVDLGIGEEYRTVIQQWEGVGILGANANITFQGGKVTVKAQFGLE